MCARSERVLASNMAGYINMVFFVHRAQTKKDREVEKNKNSMERETERREEGSEKVLPAFKPKVHL